MSLVVIVKFRNHMKQKQTVTKGQIKASNNNASPKTTVKNKEKRNNRVTKMVLSMSLNFIVGNLPLSLSPILFQVGVNLTVYSYYGIIANLFAILSHFTSIILYYKFNTKFKEVFFDTLFVTDEPHQQIYFFRPKSTNQPKTFQETT